MEGAAKGVYFLCVCEDIRKIYYGSIGRLGSDDITKNVYTRTPFVVEGGKSPKNEKHFSRKSSTFEEKLTACVCILRAPFSPHHIMHYTKIVIG